MRKVLRNYRGVQQFSGNSYPKSPYTTREEEVELMKVWRDETLPFAERTAARDRIILGVIRLIYSRARAVARNWEFGSVDDLAGDALAYALSRFDRFDPAKSKASCFFRFIVDRRMIQYLRTRTTLIRLPDLGIKTPSEEQKQLMDRVWDGARSIDAPRSEHDNRPFELIDRNNPPPVEAAEETERKTALLEAIKWLKQRRPRWAAVLELKMLGLNRKQIGRKMCPPITRERVRQIRTRLRSRSRETNREGNMLMKLPVDTMEFWRQRVLKVATSSPEIHRSVYNVSLETWQNIQECHRKMLGEIIPHGTKLLDAGCGYGALYDLLPRDKGIEYTGIDLSPDLVEMARMRNPSAKFVCCDLRDHHLPYKFDLAICRSVDGMIKDNLGDNAWKSLEISILRLVPEILLLSYEKPEEWRIVR